LSETERASGARRCAFCTQGDTDAGAVPETPIPAAELASFRDRAVAYVVDYGLANIAGLIIFFAFGLVAAVIAAAFGAGEDGAYKAALIAGLPALVVFAISYVWIGDALGGTPGKRFTKLGVVSLPDGGQLGLRRGFLRYLVQTLGQLPLFLGWLWCIWDPHKQTWHDKAAGSVVVRNPVFTSTARLPWSTPVLGVGVVALITLFVTLGVVVGVNVEESAPHSTRSNAEVDRALDRQDSQQANIDRLHEPCSPEWTSATALNEATTAEVVFGLEDVEDATGEFEAQLSALCDDGDLEAFCRGYAASIVSYKIDPGATLQSDVELECLQGLRDQ